jgi:hypothetical protein
MTTVFAIFVGKMAYFCYFVQHFCKYWFQNSLKFKKIIQDVARISKNENRANIFHFMP